MSSLPANSLTTSINTLHVDDYGNIDVDVQDSQHSGVQKVDLSEELTDDINVNEEDLGVDKKIKYGLLDLLES